MRDISRLGGMRKASGEEILLTCYQLLYLVLICSLVYHISVFCRSVEVAASGGVYGRRPTDLRARGNPSPFSRDRREECGRGGSAARNSGGLDGGVTVSVELKLGGRRRVGVRSRCCCSCERIRDPGDRKVEGEDHGTQWYEAEIADEKPVRQRPTRRAHHKRACTKRTPNIHPRAAVTVRSACRPCPDPGRQCAAGG